MTFSESDAYAMATWKRLEGHVTDDVLRAVCGAYAAISVADGDLDRREIDLFLLMARREFSLDDDALDDLEQQFCDLAEAIMSDPVAGRDRALQEVAHIRGDKHAVELVRSAARLAVGADERIMPVEIATLDAVRAALGITS